MEDSIGRLIRQWIMHVVLKSYRNSYHFLVLAAMTTLIAAFGGSVDS
jgi:hypothetical protein